MRNLRVWQDGVYPIYLQILPEQQEVIQVTDLYGMGRDTGKIYNARRTTAGFIDIISIPDQPVNVGDSFQLPNSVIVITSVEDKRPARGNYTAPEVEWMRCKFQISSRL